MATKIVGDFTTVTTPALADEHLISQSAVVYNETNQQIHDTAFLLTAKTTPIDADTLPMNDTAAANVGKKVTWANIKATLKTYFDTLYAVIITAANFGNFIVALTEKTTPIDADTVIISDSAASDDSKKVTWANIKATLKTYFDTLYTATLGVAGQLTDETVYYKKKLTFTGWNMDTTDSIEVTHSISSFTGAKVVGIYAYVKGTGTGYCNLCYNGHGGIFIDNTTTITLTRLTGGSFDDATFNNSSGAVIVEYTA
jgi:hypothetical protein